MQLRNKKTGEIIELLTKPSFVKRNEDYLQSEINTFDSLAKLNDEWEDYEEPKDFWYIDVECGVICDSTVPDLQDKRYLMEFMKAIGNYFDTREEAEKAVEKLKAVKRLKDGGCRVTEYKTYGGTTSKGNFIGEVKIILDVPNEIDKELLILLFGGEE